jgi:hypothetical protein
MVYHATERSDECLGYDPSAGQGRVDGFSRDAPAFCAFNSQIVTELVIRAAARRDRLVQKNSLNFYPREVDAQLSLRQ